MTTTTIYQHELDALLDAGLSIDAAAAQARSYAENVARRQEQATRERIEASLTRGSANAQ